MTVRSSANTGIMDTAKPQAGVSIQKFSLSGGELDDSPAGGGENRVPLRGVVSPCRLYRYQLGARQPGGGALLQQARHGRTMDKGKQAGGRDDATFLSPLSRQRGAAVVEPDRLQPREFVATPSAARADQEVVADQLAAAVGENRRTTHQTRTLLLVAAGGEPSYAAVVCRDAAENRSAAVAGGIKCVPISTAIPARISSLATPTRLV